MQPRSATLLNNPPAEPDPTCAAMARIAADPAQSGEIPRPACGAAFRWTKDSTNGHVHGQYEAGCLTVMQ